MLPIASAVADYDVQMASVQQNPAYYAQVYSTRKKLLQQA